MGKLEGRKEGRAEIAINLLKMGTLSEEQIAQVSCLPLVQIKELLTQKKKEDLSPNSFFQK
ncbi:hypothetical protein WDW89_02800 [Deltaproteobacteria bacterium TL4]